MNIIRELGVEDSVVYKEMLRMDQSTFCTILNHIERDTSPKEHMSGIKVICAPKRLELYILNFATGETFGSLIAHWSLIDRSLIAHRFQQYVKRTQQFNNVLKMLQQRCNKMNVSIAHATC